MAFRAPIKVCFADIDNAGIVYYPRFMHYFHLALEEFFEQELKIKFSAALNEMNTSFPAVHLEADFRRMLKYGDMIEMEVKVLKLGSSSIKWGYTGYLSGSNDEIVVEGSNITVCVRSDTSEKVPVPDWLKSLLLNYMNSRT